MENKYVVYGALGILVVGVAYMYMRNNAVPNVNPVTNQNGANYQESQNPENRVIDALGQLVDRGLQIWQANRAPASSGPASAPASSQYRPGGSGGVGGAFGGSGGSKNDPLQGIGNSK